MGFGVRTKTFVLKGYGSNRSVLFYNEEEVKAYAAAAKEWEAEQASNLENFVEGPRITRGNR